MKKVAYFSNTDFSLYNFRMGIMKELKKKGVEVFACGSITKKELPKKIEKEEIRFINISLKRSFDWLGGDILYFLRVFLLCRKENFNICHNFTIKPCIYASLAQKLAGVKNIYCTITGLGYVFQEDNFKPKLLRKIVVFLYKKAFRFVNRVIFQNPDDKNLFVELGIISAEKAEVIKSSGVDIDKFSPSNINSEKLESLKKEIDYKEREIYITLIGRMLWQKGVGEFVESAEKLKKKYNNLIFLLVGPIDKENPSVISQKTIKKWEKKGVVKYLGERRDIKEILAVSDIFTFPSYYKEGIPKALLEAGAMEKPLVAANVVGSKEVIKDGINGFLVKPKNVESLVNALEKLIKDKSLRIKMGEKARKKIVEDFSEEKVVKETINTYDL